MIGLDFPVKPQWIHDVHSLWQPAQPIGELVEAALAHTMQELGGEKTRRNSLTVILRYFVATEGGGQSRRTAERDVWVAYSRAYPASTMAPAYLAHLIAQNEVAQEVTRFLVRRHTLGDELDSSEVRRRAASQFGQRKVVTNAASAFLRTLQYFGVLDVGEGRGAYGYVGRLPVSREIFPLVVWAWWQRHLSPQIDLDGFRDDVALAFLETHSFDLHWRAHQPALWVLEQRPDVRRAALKYPEAGALHNAMTALLPQPLPALPQF
jgi:hypothetical protein